MSRRSVLWRDRLRAYAVHVDGVERARLRDGEQTRIEVEPGWHSVRIKIDWAGSPSVAGSIAAGEEVRFVCGPAGSLLSAGRRAIFEPDQYVALELAGSRRATPSGP